MDMKNIDHLSGNEIFNINDTYLVLPLGAILKFREQIFYLSKILDKSRIEMLITSTI